jgi:hypothetical protein
MPGDDVTTGEILRAISSARDASTLQHAGLRAAIETLTHEVQSHHARLVALEDAFAALPHQPPPPPQMPSEVKELLSEFKLEKARTHAKSQLRLEAEADAARAALTAESRRKAITWGLGVLFVAAQLITIIRGI